MKVLIITWMIIGFAIVGGVGFYIGRATAQKPAGSPYPMQGQFPGQNPTGTMPQPSGGGQQQFQPPSGGTQQIQQPKY